MFNIQIISSDFKAVCALTLALMTCAMASNALAQTSPQILENAQPPLSQSLLTVKSSGSERGVVPNENSLQSSTRQKKWVVKAVPVQTSEAGLQQKNLYGHVINAKTSEQNAPTRFIYNRRENDTQMPVYFSEEAMGSR